ncbi:MAG TPA: hypothetical protein VKQ72_00010 [Aggregatilineales bacterium]|nr:hypothetical protein [Aggregatilineales bacterium]
MNNRLKNAAVVTALAISLGAAGISAVSAQGPAGPQGPGGSAGDGMIGFGGAVCSTTNYTDVAAKALGMESSALRKALVGGQSLEQIASSKSVTVQTLESALVTAREADLKQALSDGIITQQEYDATTGLLDRLQNAPQSSTQGNTAPATPNANATPQAAPNTPGRPNLPGFPNLPFGGRGRDFANPARLLLNVPRLNVVSIYNVAAKAIGVSCADLVKALKNNTSIAQVALGKNIQAQSVIDALVSAEKTAISQDLTEGLISQVQADTRTSDAVNRMGQFVYSSRQGGSRGFGFGGILGGLRRFFGGQNGPDGLNGPNDPMNGGQGGPGMQQQSESQSQSDIPQPDVQQPSTLQSS